MAVSGLAQDLTLYLRRIGEFPLLDARQERFLAWRIVNDNDPEARQIMIQSNLRLVVSECRRHVGRGMSFMDLIAEGNVGLIRAVSLYDPALGVRFSTYAVRWIRRMIQLALLDARSLIRIPPRRLLKAEGDVNGSNSVPEVVVFRSVGHTLDPFRELQSVRDDPSTAIDAIDAVHTTLDVLGDADDRQSEVLRLRLGLAGRAPMSYRMIGRALGMSHERARQIGKSGLERLREELA